VEVYPAFCLIYIGVAEACKAAPEPRYADQPYTWRNWGNKSEKKGWRGKGNGEEGMNCTARRETGEGGKNRWMRDNKRAKDLSREIRERRNPRNLSAAERRTTRISPDYLDGLIRGGS